jgi:hypothetical protein
MNPKVFDKTKKRYTQKNRIDPSFAKNDQKSGSNLKCMI